jgi:hypothetical protein
MSENKYKIIKKISVLDPFVGRGWVKVGNSQADTSHLEREIDQLVYELYGLTEDGVRIVEGK